MSALQIPLPFAPRSRPAWPLGTRRVLRAAGSLIVVGAVVAWALLLRPQFLAGPAAYVLVSGVSMEPSLHNGDLVVAHRRDSYRIGDVVVYRVPKGETGAGSLIIHRIVGGSAAEGWVVQGDNKDVPDLWRPRNTDVAGVMWASVPGAGTVLARGMSPFGLASISTLLAAFLGLPAAVMTAVDTRSRCRRGSRERMAALPSARTGRALPSPPRLLALPAPATAPPARSTASALPAPRLLALPAPATAPPTPATVMALPADVTALAIRASTPAEELATLTPTPEPVSVRALASADAHPARERPALDIRAGQPAETSSWGEATWTASDLWSAALPVSNARLLPAPSGPGR